MFAEQSYQVVSHCSLTGAKEPNLFFSIHTLPGPPIAFRIATFHSLPQNIQMLYRNKMYSLRHFAMGRTRQQKFPLRAKTSSIT